MKKLLIVVLALMLLGTFCFAQSKAPEKVVKAFQQKFENARLVKWDKENDHEYEASFKWKGENHSANFSDTGEWLETESTITFNQLPEKVQMAFNNSHKGAVVKSVYKIETSKKTLKYEIEIKEKHDTEEFLYDSNGTLLKS
ncbi:PepSY-like domain-containing protein [Flavobacterium sp. SUN046]|uniref:PepSY-like domain-containing protein n=1 Tax=Flavobacterium sp. SUN046 TaxID=3002440 RepID=UPI002DB9675A|nr:PepSY-like domain-containing protein [Flavobacterium sp. SUN046]MEC4048629.1 PepSY-like domain-containing protein [Flavobacterium sp. SUN046]